MSKDKKLEALVVKCIEKIPLTVDDLEIANSISSASLIETQGWHAAEKIFSFIKHEFFRLRAQNKFIPLDSFKDNIRPYTRTSPLPENLQRNKKRA